MSGKYKFKPHGSGYLVFAYGDLIGRADKITRRVDSISLTKNAADFRSTFKVGWCPCHEHGRLATVATRQLAAEALWDAHNQRIREGRY